MCVPYHQPSVPTDPTMTAHLAQKHCCGTDGHRVSHNVVGVELGGELADELDADQVLAHALDLELDLPFDARRHQQRARYVHSHTLALCDQ